MLNIRFEAQGGRYRRIITFPDGATTSEDNISFPLKWHSPEPYSWIRPLHEFSRTELVDEGRAISSVLLGADGMQFLADMVPSSEPLHIVIEENPQLPEVARIPWELAFDDDRFLATDPFTHIIRQPSNIRLVKHLMLHSPLRMALISSSPKDQNPLMVEEELITVALSLGEPMASGKLVVDEIMNCTREKLRETLRNYRYDIVYFTGHGAFLDATGYLCLEMPDGTTDLMPADDFATSLRTHQRGLGLLFLNCCNAASVGAARAESWEGFGDVARKALRHGVSEVVATQSAIFDSTGRKVMKTFFEELCRKESFDVASSLAVARSDVEDDQNQFHDFYHFVHLSALDNGALREVTISTPDETAQIDWHSNVVFRTPNRMEIGRNFVGRFSYISRIEDAWWSDEVKVLGIHGLGGIGKTFLCAKMEQRALTHHLPVKRLNKSIWIDFREGTGSTLSGFLRQLDGIARDFGFQTFNKVLDDHENFPTPLEKLRPWFDNLNGICKGKALLILDNLESILDHQGNFNDQELLAWFVELIARSPGWKVLVTCRYRFEFFSDGRHLASNRWLHLAELGITERLTLVNRDAELRNRSAADKREILKTAGGHPYIINLVANYLRTHPELPEALRLASERTAEYAQLDWFLSMLTPDECDWLMIAALFPPPFNDSLIIMTKMIRNEDEDFEALETSFHAAVRRMMELSLAGIADDGLQVHPLIVYQLLENRASSYRQPDELVDATQRAIAIVFLNITRDQSRQQIAMFLLQGVEAVLKQSDRGLLKAYLQNCAGTFHGFVPASSFADIVRQAEGTLLEEADFHTLGFCAQTLCQMRHLNAASEIFTKILDNDLLPDSERGKVLGSLGTVLFEKREWHLALEISQKALEWDEKTGQQHQLGSTWHLIGNVYAEQRKWIQALESYKKALEWNEATKQYHKLGDILHQIGVVFTEQREWPQALENYQKALEWNDKTSKHHLGNTWHQIGMVYEKQKEWSHALESYQKALEWKEKTSQHQDLGGTWHQIGMVYEEQQNWAQALENYQKALEWNDITRQHHEQGGTWHQIGLVYEKQRNWSQALESYQKAQEWKEKTGQYHLLGGTWHQIGMVYEKQGNFSKALRNYCSALELIIKTDMAHNAGIILNSLRRILPSLALEERENLKEALPKELYEMLESEDILISADQK